MAYTLENTYTGNGATTQFSFTFPYLDTADIRASLNGVDTTAFTLPNATTLQFNTAPSNGVAVRIYRQTNVDDLQAVFYPGSSIRAADLNDNLLQLLYVVQETRDITVAASSGNIADNSIGSSKLADGAVTLQKLAANLLYSVP